MDLAEAQARLESANHVMETQIGLFESFVAISEEGDRQGQEVVTGLDHVRNLSETAIALAAQGRKGLEGVVREMSAMDVRLGTIGKSVEHLSALSAEILSIVSTLQGIAARTHLLSLNATIEALQASGNGNAFAIIAQEIRKLASGSKEAATRVEDLIGRISGSIEQLVGDSDLALQSTLSGVAAVREIQQTFREIDSQVAALGQEDAAVHAMATRMAEDGRALVGRTRLAAANRAIIADGLKSGLEALGP